MMNKKRHYLTFALVYVCKPPEDLVKTAGLVHWLSTCAVGGKRWSDNQGQALN